MKAILTAVILVILCLIAIDQGSPYLTIAASYPGNLLCHARGYEFYYNNPPGIQCTNSPRPAGSQAFCGVAMNRSLCSKPTQSFFGIYRNEHS